MNRCLYVLVQRVPNQSSVGIEAHRLYSRAIMLSKWLLVSLLALGVQNISAGNYIARNFDVTKFNMVFYDPNTHMALKGSLENFSRGPFSGIGFHGMKCNCEGFVCGCCNGINISVFNFNRSVCTNFTFQPEEFAIRLKLILNDKEVLSTGPISGKNPPPFCVPVYPPFVSVCVRVYDIYLSGRNLHACLDFEVLAVTWPFLVLHFDCVKVGADGFSWAKPGDDGNVPLNTMLAVLKPEVNGPEIYDQVDFEPDLNIESPNNHTPNTTSEDNIGQLKL